MPDVAMCLSTVYVYGQVAWFLIIYPGFALVVFKIPQFIYMYNACTHVLYACPLLEDIVLFICEYTF